MAKRKKPKPKKRKATLGDALGIARKPKLIYRCLGCGNEGHPSKMLVCVMVGDHKVPNSHIPVIPGKVVVRAPVCRFCHEERMESNGGE